MSKLTGIEVPIEWENLYGNRANFVNVFLLIAFSFVVAGWKSGLLSLIIAFCVEYVYKKTGQKRYKKIEREFRGYVLSGLYPCLVYAINDAALGHKWSIVVDDKLSRVYSEINADKSSLSFRPVIIFLSDEQKERLEKGHFTSPSKLQDFYAKNIAVLHSYGLTKENLIAIVEALQWRKDLKDEEEIEQEKDLALQNLFKRDKK